MMVRMHSFPISTRHLLNHFNRFIDTWSFLGALVSFPFGSSCQFLSLQTWHIFVRFNLALRDFRCLLSDYLLASAQRGLAHSDISPRFYTVEDTRRYYQLHYALLLDVARLKYLHDDSNLRSAGLS